MKCIPWSRKAFGKARNRKSRERVVSFNVSLMTGKVINYITKDGTEHRANNAWKVIDHPVEDS